MGQDYSIQAKFYSRVLTALFIIGHAASSIDAKSVKTETRDPRQLTMMVADFDGTLGHNVGHYRLRRVGQIEAVTPFFQSISSLPEEILVPVHDFEGNIGPRIGKRLGHLDTHGRFVPSTSLEPVKLSNGETIVPGYYFFDLQSSLKEFRPVADGKSFLVRALEDKMKSREPFLLDAFPLFATAMHKDYADRVKGAILTMRGHSPAEWRDAFELLETKLKLAKPDWRDEAFVSLSHPDYYEFAFSKTRYLERLFDELTDRNMTDKTTPHFLVMYENDREYLRQIDDLFKQLSNRGVFANPVVPVLVNLVEEPVLQNPDGHNWDHSPMRVIEKMSRVTVYWPGKVERSDNLSRVLELTLGMKPAEAAKFMTASSKMPYRCDQHVLAMGVK